ncbi:unnamed protein product [Orchesella dallaii]|uniref:Uncharacterized protein n=1 Tax=Orchesella dallaii TaxID=48710 RepID=A0ABP1R7Z0_9HEXA
MSDDTNAHDDTFQEASTNNDNDQSGQSPTFSEQLPDGSVNDDNLNPDDIHEPNSSELQRRRTEALERILLASDSNLSLSQSPDPARRPQLSGAVRRLGMAGLRDQRRRFFNRRLLSRDDLERAIFIPIRTRSAVSGINLPPETADNTSGNSVRDLVERSRLGSGNGDNNSRRINVSTFFMELTYSTDLQPFHLFKNSGESQKRRLEIHAANTISLIQEYCPVKQNKLSQFRYCVKMQRQEQLDFKCLDINPLEVLDPAQIKCNTKVIVIAQDDYNNEWGNPFTSHLLSKLNNKHVYPTCITFESDLPLITLIEHLNDLHTFSGKVNINDTAFSKKAKNYLVMGTLAKLLENWNIPVLILDATPSNFINTESIKAFAEKFQIKTFEYVSEGESSRQVKAKAKQIGKLVRKALLECNLQKLRLNLAKRNAESGKNSKDTKMSPINSTLLNDDCRKIVLSLHERMNSVHHQLTDQGVDQFFKETSRISLLEDGILADIENSEAFKYGTQTPNSKSSLSGRTCLSRGSTTTRSGDCETERRATFSASDDRESNGRPRTSYSQSDDDVLFPSAIARDQEKVSELLFNELNQRWRVQGPQTCIPPGSDAGPYCDALLDSEKQLLLSIIQEVTNFEILKDIRNELKDSKKDLEGRLYGYNPDFTNLIASAEEFLHGKSSCMEPCKDELEFYKMPVSFVYSEAEVKYMKAKPPLYLLTAESPSQTIKMAIEESTKLFLDAVKHATCGSRRISFSRRNHTKAIVVIEDNNEVLELLTVALWFFEKTPLATFQAKYCHNREEFLLTLDACRLYFGTYPAYLARKDERIFERWLGVGMNDILRSHNSKILLIDFPRPGMLLQRSKNILINRLKLEEKLHNIKSFIISKPTKKEDNLSTVENILDEIHKCLDSRDKLLFRKARRMYLDLKLYKQIEQKSRQDVKSLREWGLPEPDTEHDLWERLRNSDIVLNGPIPPLELIHLPCIQEIQSLASITSDSNFIENATSISNADIALSETETCSVNPNSVAEIHSEEDTITLVDVTLNATHETETLEDIDEFCNNNPDVYSQFDTFDEVYDDDYLDSFMHQIENSANCTNRCLSNGVRYNTSSNRSNQDEDLMETCTHDLNSAADLERTISRGKRDHNLDSITDLRPSSENILNQRQRNSNKIHISCKNLPSEEGRTRTSTEDLTHQTSDGITKCNHSLSAVSTEELLNATLQRSPGFLNLYDDDLLTESIHYNPRFKTSNLMNVTDVDLDEEHKKAYTRIEFTLAPKVTSGESSSRSSISLQKTIKLNKTFEAESLSSVEARTSLKETQSEIVNATSSTDIEAKEEDFIDLEVRNCGDMTNSSVNSINSNKSTAGLINSSRTNERSSWLSTVRRYLQLRTGKNSNAGKPSPKLKK